MLHLVPQWQSAERHRKLKVMMQDRPDLIKSELAGLAFDSLQQVFRKADLDAMFSAPPLAFVKDQEIFVVIDPAAGGPSSDYAVVSLCRQRGIVTVRLRYAIPVRALHHKAGHALRRAEKDRHQLEAQVRKEARELRVVLVEVHQFLLELAVDVQQQEEDAHLVRVRGRAHVAPQPLDRVAARAGKKLSLQKVEAAVDARLHVLCVDGGNDLFDHVCAPALTFVCCAGHRHRHALRL